MAGSESESSDDNDAFSDNSDDDNAGGGNDNKQHDEAADKQEEEEEEDQSALFSSLFAEVHSPAPDSKSSMSSSSSSAANNSSGKRATLQPSQSSRTPKSHRRALDMEPGAMTLGRASSSRHTTRSGSSTPSSHRRKKTSESSSSSAAAAARGYSVGFVTLDAPKELRGAGSGGGGGDDDELDGEFSDVPIAPSLRACVALSRAKPGLLAERLATALSANGVEHRRVARYAFRAIDATTQVRVEFVVVRVARLRLSGVRARHVQGAAWPFKRLVQTTIDAMKLNVTLNPSRRRMCV
jgi:hypothetical protein